MSRRNTVFREIEKLKIVNYSLLGKISKLIQKVKFQKYPSILNVQQSKLNFLLLIKEY